VASQAIAKQKQFLTSVDQDFFWQRFDADGWLCFKQVAVVVQPNGQAK
jgi:hypothetical protein